jgi:peptidoglycan/xylan/chitin deacetylase (PgdA/CDA1 family)
MKYFIGKVLGRFIKLIGVVNRAKNAILSQDVITSVYFHNPSRDLFEKCVNWFLGNGFKFISLDELYDILMEEKKFTKGLVCFTVDDGLKENMTNIIPIVREFSIPITFFLSTEPIENGVFWWTYAFKDIKFSSEYLKDKSKILKMPESEKKKHIEEIKNKYSIQREAMTISEVTEIAKIPEVLIGSHTINHAITKNCSDTESEFEISESKKILENWIGKEIKYFSYPNGDFSKREEKYLCKYKYKLAFTTEQKFISKEYKDKLYYLPRFSINDDGSFSENLLRMIGIWNKYSKV